MDSGVDLVEVASGVGREEVVLEDSVVEDLEEVDQVEVGKYKRRART